MLSVRGGTKGSWGAITLLSGSAAARLLARLRLGTFSVLSLQTSQQNQPDCS